MTKENGENFTQELDDAIEYFKRQCEAWVRYEEGAYYRQGLLALIALKGRRIDVEHDRMLCDESISFVRDMFKNLGCDRPFIDDSCRAVLEKFASQGYLNSGCNNNDKK